MDAALLEKILVDEPAYRGRQIWEWAARGASGYDEMTNVPASLRARLAAEVPFSTLTVEQEAHANDGTLKALFSTRDGHPVEAVRMRYRDGRRSVCVSSQSGCPLTCTFCATGQDRKSTRLNSSHVKISYAVFCLKKKKKKYTNIKQKKKKKKEKPPNISKLST